MQILKTVQKFRDRFYCVEFLDCNSLKFIQKDQRPDGESDLIFIEYPLENQQVVFESFVEELEGVGDEDVFVMERSKFQKFRMDVPRGIQEFNSRNQIVKKGTDVQVRIEDFKDLMESYREFSESGIEYFLFGHFGDAHLHFNFLANKEQEEECDRILDHFYDNIRTKLICSPFAEHGIGLIKQKYVKPFYGSVQLRMFKELKSIHDPHKQFFPKGFMWSAIES